MLKADSVGITPESPSPQAENSERYSSVVRWRGLSAQGQHVDA
jgi:hypothetical protein